MRERHATVGRHAAEHFTLRSCRVVVVYGVVVIIKERTGGGTSIGVQRKDMRRWPGRGPRALGTCDAGSWSVARGSRVALPTSLFSPAYYSMSLNWDYSVIMSHDEPRFGVAAALAWDCDLAFNHVLHSKDCHLPGGFCAPLPDELPFWRDLPTPKVFRHTEWDFERVEPLCLPTTADLVETVDDDDNNEDEDAEAVGTPAAHPYRNLEVARQRKEQQRRFRRLQQAEVERRRLEESAWKEPSKSRTQRTASLRDLTNLAKTKVNVKRKRRGEASGDVRCTKKSRTDAAQ